MHNDLNHDGPAFANWLLAFNVWDNCDVSAVAVAPLAIAHIQQGYAILLDHVYFPVHIPAIVGSQPRCEKRVRRDYWYHKRAQHCCHMGGYCRDLDLASDFKSSIRVCSLFPAL